MKHSKKGSVLAVTLALTTVFTIFGLSSLYFGTLYNEATENNIISKKAFWLAEAGVQKAITQIIAGDTDYNNEPGDTLGEGSYRVWVLPYCYDEACNEISPYRWWIESKGVVNSAIERIKVEYGLTPFKAFNSESEEGFDKNTDPDDYIAEKSYMTGLTLDEEYFAELFGFPEPIDNPPADVDNIYINPNNDGDIDTVNGITWIKLEGNRTLNISSNNWQGEGLLIVEGGTLRISGGTFRGIMWVRGDLDFGAGNREIYGSIFVSCGEDGETMIQGQKYPQHPYSIQFDREAIDDVFARLENGGGGDWHYAVVSWKQALPPFSWE